MPGGRGNRFMYYATGQPGWMRFGYSPGWVGRSASGLGPCAEYIMMGRWPTPQAPAGMPFAPPGLSPEQELQMLRNQARMLKQQLDQVNERIKKLEEK